jgi:hypothetical protein
VSGPDVIGIRLSRLTGKWRFESVFSLARDASLTEKRRAAERF